MWKNLFGMTKKEWQQMKFSTESMKKFKEMKKLTFDKEIVLFLERCLVDNHRELAVSFEEVYETFEKFFSQIQGKISSLLQWFSIQFSSL